MSRSSQPLDNARSPKRSRRNDFETGSGSTLRILRLVNIGRILCRQRRSAGPIPRSPASPGRQSPVRYEVQINLSTRNIVYVGSWPSPNGREEANEGVYYEVHDCDGHTLCPGLVDIQINGAYGIDFSNPSCDFADLRTTCVRLARERGVTSILPTVVSSPPEVYARLLRWRKPAIEEGYNGAKLLGWHFEGPFMSPKYKGAHDASCMLDPTVENVKKIYFSNDVKNDHDSTRIPLVLVTMAPELPGAMDAITHLTKDQNVVVSLGHTDASYEVCHTATKSGASLLTHTFNAMAPFHHRKPGPVGLVVDGTMPRCSVICDGHHVSDVTIKMLRAVRPGGIILVSDGMAASGSEDGEYVLGDVRVTVKDGKATVTGTGTLAGSCATLDQCVGLYRIITGCTWEEAWEAGSLRPAEAVNVDDVGIVEVGKRGDVALWEGVGDNGVYDKDTSKMKVICCWVGGREVN
uniref:N-acetylglucosamine-6-phosphate deacetylase n=1 Tax=Corethron hystrix TaxID=216773 RepID=A0A7S1BL04_9STRA|mmetsp:Transcript_29859/g.68508  ORF Transcript_29859/g.68508 Transcript_29859/m.68508 type:complete len:464 (+) Transcript_29859:143-1534(+)